MWLAAAADRPGAADYPDSKALFPGTDSGGECGVPYEMRFPAPMGLRDEPWYRYGAIVPAAAGEGLRRGWQL
jgi:hypothetical protein